MDNQLLLVPPEPITFEDGQIALVDLPKDEELVGPPPSAPILEQTRQYCAILEPVIVERVAKPKAGQSAYIVRRGRRRIKAARAVMAEYFARAENPPSSLFNIPARIMPPQAGHIGLLVDANAHSSRKDNASAEILAIKKFMDSGLNEKDVAAVTCLSLATVQKRLVLLELIPALWEAMLAGKIPGSVAESAASVPKALQEELAAILADKGKLTGKDVHDIKRARAQNAGESLPWQQIESEEMPAPKPAPRKESPEELVAAVGAYFAVADREARHAFLRRLLRVPELSDETFYIAILMQQESAAATEAPVEEAPPVEAPPADPKETARKAKLDKIFAKLNDRELDLTKKQRQTLEEKASKLMTDEEKGLHPFPSAVAEPEMAAAH